MVEIPPPRSDTDVFFLIFGSLALIRLVGFSSAMLNNFPFFLSERILFDSESKKETTVNEAVIDWDVRFIGALLLMVRLNALPMVCCRRCSLTPVCLTAGTLTT